MMLEYSFTTIDPKDGRARTFTVVTDSRTVALAQIRGAVQKINRDRAASGGRLLARPNADQLDAYTTARSPRLTGLVAIYA